MIRASFKVFTARNVEVMDASVGGVSINSVLVNVKKKIKSVRTAARKNGEPDPLRNWSGIELFLNKSSGHLPKKEKPSNAD